MTDPTCPLCKRLTLASPDELAMQACKECADKIGLIPMPPSRRRPMPCARCNGQQFLRVIPREHTGIYASQESAPMYLTHAPPIQKVWGLSIVKPVAIAEGGHGLLETYVCRSCGAVEWYCVDVERIPVHPHLMSEAIDHAGDTPYR